jgi:TusA-related sulfurtransferase
VLTLTGLSTSYEIKAETNTDLEDNPATNERGRKLVPLTFSTDLNSALGVNVEREIAEWEKLVGMTGYFYLSGKKFGPKLMLKKVGLSDVLLDDFGRMHRAQLDMTFEEITEETMAIGTATALAVGASAEAKAEKKTVNTALASAGSTGLKVGSAISIVGANYATGQKIPQWVKDRTHTVSQISGEKALIGGNGGINSWVYTKDLSLA